MRIITFAPAAPWQSWSAHAFTDDNRVIRRNGLALIATGSTEAEAIANLKP